MIRGVEALKHRYEVCVAGAGPVGIALALELSSAGVRTLLVDAGPRRPRKPDIPDTGFDVPTSDKHEGDRATLAKGLGGTSARWGGRCVRFDEIDFETRDYIGDHVWPLGAPDIAPFYDRALEILTAEAMPIAVDAAPGEFQASRESWASRRNTASAHRSRLAGDRNLSVVLNARVQELVFDPTESRIQSLKVACDGQVCAIEADQFVLSCGGRGNTRLLMNLQARFPALFGGDEGVLGKFYMGHLTGEIASVQFSSYEASRPYLINQGPGLGFVRDRFLPSNRVQRELAISNIALWPQKPEYKGAIDGDVEGSLAYLWRVARGGQKPNSVSEVTAHILNAGKRPVRATRATARFLQWQFNGTSLYWFLPDPENRYALRYHAEQVPNDRSRISLKHDRDADGQLRLNVEFGYLDQDYASVVRAHLALDGWLQKSGLGKLVFKGNQEALLQQVADQASDGYHQIGCTRMGTSRVSAVVDRDCKVFDVQNLFVAGSSVFVTSGQANPTLPAVALAVRLGRHIAARTRPS